MNTDQIATWIALLRGINVGGKNKLPMRELAAMFAAAGCESVQTYIQSGNVVYEAGPDLGPLVPALIADEIEEQFGYRIPLVVRTLQEFEDVAKRNPFLGDGDAPDGMHVAFLADVPSQSRVAQLDQDRSPLDVFLVSGREIFLHCPNGMGRTKLTNAYFDSTLATTSTIRNWRTVLALLRLAQG